jgi:hypothetical protein
MIYLLTILNAVILGIVAYLFYNFRKALESSGVRQVDDYLHELEGSVAQLTEQFERSSTKLSKDLLRKTTELQSLIGECDTKLAEAARLRANGSVSAADVLAGRAARPASAPARSASGSDPRVQGPAMAGVPTIPPAVAARRLSASEAVAHQVQPRPAERAAVAASNAREPAVAEGMEITAAPTALGELDPSLPSADYAAPSGESQPMAAGVGQPNEKYRLIFLLASEGMDPASIAKHTNLTRGEVEMLLDLRRQGKI